MKHASALQNRPCPTHDIEQFGFRLIGSLAVISILCDFVILRLAFRCKDFFACIP